MPDLLLENGSLCPLLLDHLDPFENSVAEAGRIRGRTRARALSNKLDMAVSSAAPLVLVLGRRGTRGRASATAW